MNVEDVLLYARFANGRLLHVTSGPCYCIDQAITLIMAGAVQVALTIVDRDALSWTFTRPKPPCKAARPRYVR